MLKQIDYQGKLEEIAEKFQGRKTEVSKEVNKTVQQIVADIQKSGDTALFNYAKKFDGYDVNTNNLLVTRMERETGLEQIDEDYFRILRRTKSQIEEFHKHQLGNSWNIFKENGVIMGQIARPLERVALYVPGGTAAYPSTVIMNAVPALLAGVKEIIMITPVKADGKVNPNILAAAEVCGIETIYKVGGAQGVAAVAYGTESIPKVDKIVGPGNIFVATAKKICYGVVDIDMIAGPSEVLVI
ncbi:MAG TPA: histidinol dehydrogenase, partial [Lactococcus lactis]|nr:histidinol dehydrogenase [Lactococcus lactis]